MKGDTVQCYTLDELKIIASRIVDAAECDTMLSLTNIELMYKDSMLVNMDNQMYNIRQISSANKNLYDDSLVIIEDLEEALELEIKAHKRTRIKFSIIGIGMLVGGGYLLTR